jgi:SpoVK/Ycf46/Vps4 family AAA+-type ATPase
MATAEQVKALLRSYSEANGDHFVSVALQIAADAARTGKSKIAQELRDLVDDIKRKQAANTVPGPVPIARPTGELAGLLAVTYPRTRLSEMVLNESACAELQRIAREYRQQEKLREHGLSSRRKLLLIGPPGCGKTMTASALGGELRLPLFSVQLHGLITKFMGETAAKLYMIFDAMRQTRGIYFFDEFDAIGADRGTKNDVGEIRRVLNSFLQFLEQDDSDSIILAATNYVEMLDDALFRRFDEVIRYERPHARQVDQLIQNRLQTYLIRRPGWKSIRDAASGLSHADIARACDDAAKDYILRGRKHIRTAELVKILKRRRLSHATAGREHSVHNV